MPPDVPTSVTDPTRLAALASYAILDTPPEAGFDDIALLTRQLCDVPVALVSLVAADRQWFKARAGFPLPETDLERSVCAHALDAPDLLVIPDLARDPRTRANPLVTGEPRIRFYAGAPLRTADGRALGSLCAIDHAPRPAGLSAAQADGLRALARQVMGQLDLRRTIAHRDGLLREQARTDRERDIYRETQTGVSAAEGNIAVIFERLLDGAMQAVPSAEAGAIALIAGDGLHYRAVRGSLVPHLGLQVPLAESLAGVCASRNEPLLVPDAQRDARARRDLVELLDMRAAVFAPVSRGGTPIGVLKLQSSRPDVFTRHDLEMARLFAEGVTSGLTEARAATAQRAVETSESRYRTLFDSIDEGFCIIEFLDGPQGPLSDYVHVEANAAYAKHAGIPNVVGQKVREMVPGEAAGWVELYGEVLRTGQPIRFERELVATGRHLELAAFRVDPASRRQVAVLFQDVTARRRAELALRELNETLEARVVEALAERKILADIVEGTSAFVQVADPQFRLLAINSAAAGEFARIFGVLPKVGDSLLDLLADQPEHAAAVRVVWARALAGEEFVEIGELGDPQRDRRHYEMRFGALRDAAGRLIGAYQFVYDVSERLAEQERLQRTEEALRQSQKMEAVGQLTGGIAHDFNNLLTGIIGSLELLTTRVAQGRLNDVDRYATAAQGAAKRAAALTHRLLAFSRRQTLDPKPTDVNRLVAGMEELVRRSVGPAIRIEVVAAGGLWATLVDPPQLESALLNLCINARDAMPNGGAITIETANRWLDPRFAKERDLEPGQYISLCVSDTGSGMSPDVIAKAFDPFFTTKPIGQGTGLGLSMIYGFVRQSGGQVRIYSEVGAGTNVCLYLPRHVGGAETAEAAPDLADAPRARAGETVLVVDDEPTVRMLVTEVLEELGYAAIEAADGPSGLKVMQSDVRIDLVVTDVGLPGGMNGRQMVDAARVSRPMLKALFITGYAENAVVGNGHLAPGMHVMTKPFAMETLAARIKELIVAR